MSFAAAFRSAEPCILVANDACGACNAGAQILWGDFPTQQIRPDERIAKQLAIVAKVTKEVLYRDIPS